MIGRRELITLLGGAAATWLLAARAPSTHLHGIVRLQPAAVARAGVLSGGTPPPPAPQRLQRESRDLIGRPEAANHSPRGQKRALGSHAGVAQGEIGAAPQRRAGGPEGPRGVAPADPSRAKLYSSGSGDVR
jgi:hypothetical protein